MLKNWDLLHKKFLDKYDQVYGFNFDDTILFHGYESNISYSICENGGIKTYKIFTQKKIFCLTLSNKSNWFICGVNDGTIISYVINQKQLWVIQCSIQIFQNLIIKMILNKNEDQLIVSCNNSQIGIFNIDQNDKNIYQYQILINDQDVIPYDITINNNDSIIASLCQNGSITIWRKELDWQNYTKQHYYFCVNSIVFLQYDQLACQTLGKIKIYYVSQQEISYLMKLKLDIYNIDMTINYSTYQLIFRNKDNLLISKNGKGLFILKQTSQNTFQQIFQTAFTSENFEISFSNKDNFIVIQSKQQQFFFDFTNLIKNC